MKKIDIHCHLRSRNLNEDLKKLEQEAKKHNIKKIFLLPTYFPDKGSGISNYRLYHNIKNKKLFKMYLSFDMNFFYMALNEMEELLENDRDKIVGIKIYTGYQDIDLNCKNIEVLMKLAQEYKLPIVFHTGYVKGAGRSKAYNPFNLINFVQYYSKLNFIIAHLGNPYIKEMKELLKLKNVYTDISGMMEDSINFSNKDKDYFLELFQSASPEKFLYGTDYPVQTYKQTNRLLENLSNTDKKKIMYKNIKDLFNV